MDLTISEEQALLRDSVARFLERSYSFDQRRTSLALRGGVNPVVWSGFAELGLFALPFDEEFGGLGGDAFSFGLAMESAGRHLVVEPLVPAICLAGGVLARAGNASQRERWLVPLMCGDTLLALAAGGNQASSILSVTGGESGWCLTGRAPIVLGGEAADAFVVCAHDTERTLRIFMVSADAAGLTRRRLRLTDQSCAAEIDFSQVKVSGEAEIRGNAAEALTQARRYAVTAAGWEAVGAMSAMLEQTIDYVKQREQFGRPIASFQVVQHNLAEMAVAREEALAAVMLASLTPSKHEALAARTAAVAKVKIVASADVIAKSAVQMHGGMGVSDELPIASYFRKLLGYSVLHGSAETHLDYIVSKVLSRGEHLKSPILDETRWATPTLGAAA